jgi:DNA-binding GntR family transcriptional regulator
MSTDEMAPDTALSDHLVDELQRRIFSGDLPVGSWLRHAALAEEFGVSRTPVREALRVLEAQGIVTIVQNRGARVNGHSGRDIRELGAIRAELEGLAAELAASRIDDDQLDRLQSAWRDYEEAIGSAGGDPAKGPTSTLWAEANEAFHSVILQASGNRQLGLSIADISRRLPRNSAYAAYAGNSRLLRMNNEEHKAIADAIANGDARRARTAMTRHIHSAAEAMARWVEDQHPDPRGA